MKPRTITAFIAPLTLIYFAAPVFAQEARTPPVPPRNRPGAKPPSKPTPKLSPAKTATGNSSGPVVLGTNQLPGDFGQIGQTYTVGASEPLNFTLTGAEYVTGRYTAGEDTFVPNASEKLLVLHYTVHNPTPREQMLTWGSFHFTAVDAKDINHEAKSVAVREGTTEKVSVSLKPAQKLSVQAVVVVPAEGVTPKLIVQRETGGAVVRYDLRGKVKPLPAPFADPADASGATARKMVPAQAGTWYPMGNFDVRLESAAYTTAPLGNGEDAEEPGDGKRYVTFTVTVRNASAAEWPYDWGTFEPTLLDAAGEKHDFNQRVLRATKNETAQGNLKPGEEVRLRYFFGIGTEDTAKTLMLTYLNGGDPTFTLSFDVSDLAGK